MLWATLQSALRQAVISATGVPAGDCYWQGAKEAGYAHKSPRVELSCPSFARIGWDEQRTKFTAPSTRTVAHVGNRRLTVTVRFEVDAQTPGADGAHYASLLTTRIDRKAPRALLKAAKLAVTEVKGAQKRDYVVEKRMVSVWIVDLIVYAAEIDFDADPNATAWIETAHGESPAGANNDLDGAEFDAP